jgi:WD40 repeat protein
VWDASTGRLLAALSGHGLAVLSCAFSPDGARLATTSEDRTARLWDVETGEPLLSFAGHRESVLTAAFDASGARLFTASADRTVRGWDTLPERRAPEELLSLVRCRLPFHLADERLLPGAADPGACPPRTP